MRECTVLPWRLGAISPGKSLTQASKPLAAALATWLDSATQKPCRADVLHILLFCAIQKILTLIATTASIGAMDAAGMPVLSTFLSPLTSHVLSH